MKVKRRKTRQVRIGNVKIGGDAPVSIQSMAKSITSDIRSTINGIRRLEEAGCEIIRVAVKNEADACAIEKIKKGIKIPLVADIHFNYRLALSAMMRGADAIRLNPGNIYKKKEIWQVVKSALKAGISIRVGANSGSLRGVKAGMAEDDAMVKSVRDYIKYIESLGFRDIIISLKSSDVLMAISAYRKISRVLNYPLHIGVTATGIREDGVVKSSMAVGALLLDGIGDTLRVSLTSDPVFEVETAKTILQSLGLRSFGPEVISCPTCGRCRVDIEKVVRELKNKLYASRERGSRLAGKHSMLNIKPPITIAVMGCEVNGPGEAKNAHIGIAAGKGTGVLFKKGKIIKRVKEKDFVKAIEGAL